MLVMSKGALTAARAETYYEENLSRRLLLGEATRWSAMVRPHAEDWACPGKLRPRISAPASRASP